MSETAYRESPLVQCRVIDRGMNENPGVVLSERPFLGHLNLRGNPADESFLEAVKKVLGLALPQEPNTVEQGEELTVFWLGPNEWLIVTPPDHQETLLRSLREALSEIFTAVTDVSGGQTVITLSGPHARDVLAKGCTLDLHPRVFAPGRCAQTLISKSGALLRQRDDASFEIIVRRSFADYLWHWLEDAAGEYGLKIEAAV